MKKRKQFRSLRNLLLGGVVCLGLGLVYIFLEARGVGIPCLFDKVTGLSCPGCGNTRAVLALLRLDVSAALGYNLLFPLEFFYIGWVLLHCCRSCCKGSGFAYDPPFPWLDCLLLTLILLWWLLRNIWGI